MWLFIGVSIGLILGLTGSGGALLAIPLFMNGLNYSLKEASILSLIVVVLGSFFNLFNNYKLAEVKTSFGLFLFSFLGSWLGLKLKPHLSDQIIVLFLLLISLYGLWSVWFEKKQDEQGHTQNRYFLIILSGIFIGFVTTITGLGGGILLVPILMGVIGLNYDKAIATSLLSIVLIAGFSFFMQMTKSDIEIQLWSVGEMAMGLIASVFFLKFAFRRISIKKQKLIRKAVFTLVVIYSLASLFISLKG